MIQTVEDYFKHCEPREKQNMASVFIYSIKHVTRTFCRKRKIKKITKFYQVAPCLNKYILQDVCIMGFASQSKPLILAPIGNDKMKHICWSVLKFQKKTFNSF